MVTGGEDASEVQWCTDRPLARTGRGADFCGLLRVSADFCGLMRCMQVAVPPPVTATCSTVCKKLRTLRRYHKSAAPQEVRISPQQSANMRISQWPKVEDTAARQISKKVANVRKVRTRPRISQIFANVRKKPHRPPRVFAHTVIRAKLRAPMPQWLGTGLFTMWFVIQ